MEPRALILKTTIVAALVVLVDEAMKLAVRQTLAVCAGAPTSSCERIDLAGPVGLLRFENAGSALGFLQGMWVWVLIAALGLALLPLYGQRLKNTALLAPAALGFQAGGAIANLMDRALFGGVTDFIDVGIGVIFNPADVALLAGMVLALEALRRSGESERSMLAVPEHPGLH